MTDPVPDVPAGAEADPADRANPPAGPTEAVPCLAVPLSDGEDARRDLLDEGALRTDLKVRRDGEVLLLPVTQEAAQAWADTGPGEPGDAGTARGWTAELRRATFEVVERAPRDYRDLLELPADVLDRLPSSFDRIGDLVVFKLPDEVLPYRAMVGAALQEFVAGCRTVALDHGVEGRFRVRDLEVVAGDPSTETVHREHGVEMRVDPARAYFSPRLATERRRVAGLVQPGERVVDAFAGVGPFSLVVAAHADPDRVVAIELNPDAYDLLVANVETNGVGGVVVPVEGDAGQLLPDHDPADRVVMNLPHAAADYLDAARRALAPGGTIHLYEVVEGADLDDRRAALEADGFEVAAVREVHTYSPTSSVVVFDLRGRGGDRGPGP